MVIEIAVTIESILKKKFEGVKINNKIIYFKI